MWSSVGRSVAGVSVDRGVLLRVSRVSVRYGGLWALRGVDLTVFPGEIRGLIGPNGAGKSTLLHTVSGIVRPTAGTVTFNEQTVTDQPAHQLWRLGIARTFQKSALFPGLTVVENVMVGLHRQVAGMFDFSRQSRHGEYWAYDTAFGVLRRLGLEQLADREISALSVVDRKLVEIARALATRPTLLLLDEPAAGLSSVELRALTDLLRTLNRSDGITIVLVEHIMDLVMELCGRITVLNYGEVLAEGRPDEIRSDASVIDAYLGKQTV